LCLAGGWIFNTEAHPIDPGSLYCCSAKRQTDDEYLQRFKDSIDFVSLLDLTDPFLNNQTNQLDENDLTVESQELNSDKVSQKETQKEAEKELEYYEKSWNDSEIEQQNNEETTEEPPPEPVIEKPPQSIVPAVEAIENPPKHRRRSRRRRSKHNKSAKTESELDSRKIVKEQVRN
jgi:hypothetical protein